MIENDKVMIQRGKKVSTLQHSRENDFSVRIFYLKVKM